MVKREAEEDALRRLPNRQTRPIVASSFDTLLMPLLRPASAGFSLDDQNSFHDGLLPNRRAHFAHLKPSASMGSSSSSRPCAGSAGAFILGNRHIIELTARINLAPLRRGFFYDRALCNQICCSVLSRRVCRLALNASDFRHRNQSASASFERVGLPVVAFLEPARSERALWRLVA